MSEFGIFEAAAGSEAEQKIAAQEARDKLAAAIYDVKRHYGPFLFASTGLDDFDNRVALVKEDMIRTVMAHVPPVTGTMRRIVKAVKAEYKQLQKQAVTIDEIIPGGVPKKKKKDYEPKEHYYLKAPEDSWIPEVDSRRGDVIISRRRLSKDDVEQLVPEGNWDGYLESVDDNAEGKIDHLFVSEARRRVGEAGPEEEKLDAPPAPDAPPVPDEAEAPAPLDFPEPPVEDMPPLEDILHPAPEDSVEVPSGPVADVFVPEGLEDPEEDTSLPWADLDELVSDLETIAEAEPGDALVVARRRKATQAVPKPWSGADPSPDHTQWWQSWNNGWNNRHNIGDPDKRGRFEQDMRSLWTQAQGGGFNPKDSMENGAITFRSAARAVSKHKARLARLASAAPVQTYVDWCRSNGLKVASHKNLERFSTNLNEDEFRVVKAFVRAAEISNSDPSAPYGGTTLASRRSREFQALLVNLDGEGEIDSECGCDDDKGQEKESMRKRALGPGEKPALGPLHGPMDMGWAGEPWAPESEDDLDMEAVALLHDLYYNDPFRKYGPELDPAAGHAGLGGVDPSEIDFEAVNRMTDMRQERERKRTSSKRTAGGGTSPGGNTAQSLLKAGDEISNLLNDLASQFQESVAPLQQALQAIEYAKQVQMMSNPMGVMPAGGLNVLPQQSPTGGPALGEPAFADPAIAQAMMGAAAGLGGMGGGAPAPGPEQQMMMARKKSSQKSSQAGRSPKGRAR